MDKTFREALAESPIVAVLRNVEASEGVAIGEALVGAGVTTLEVPLNSRDALATVEALMQKLRNKAFIGVGTVLTPQDVSRASICGAKFIFSPNTDGDVLNAARRLGLASVAGVATPTEAFNALKLGATALKIFPGEMFPPKIIKAFRLVLPKEVLLLVSGGVSSENIKAYADAGADGFGVQGALCAPGLTPEQVSERAKKLVAALKEQGE